MKKHLRSPLEHMLQGLAYWLAYKRETVKYLITEHEAVGEAIQILESQLASGYKIVKEFPYCKVCSKYSVHQHADVAIINPQGECDCIIEFKIAGSTNGGYKADIKKMANVKKDCPDIDCYVVILYSQSCNIDVPKNLVDGNGKAIKKPIPMNSTKIRVRRVCNAVCSKNAKKMKKTICIELL